MAPKSYEVAPYALHHWGQWLLKEEGRTIFDSYSRSEVIVKGHEEAKKNRGILVIQDVRGATEDILNYETGQMIRQSEMPPF